jgi:hypothetical protein
MALQCYFVLGVMWGETEVTALTEHLVASHLHCLCGVPAAVWVLGHPIR